MDLLKLKFGGKMALVLGLGSCFCLAQTYTGSGSVTQGTGVTTTADLYPGCTGSRVSAVGTITSTDAKTWTVPAQTSFASGPYLPDLYNQCTGVMPANLNAVNLNSVPVTVIENTGDTITGYLFGDNYFELYINGVLVGADPVPYTPFNSCVVRFKVSKPYTIAVKLVDWEENLGLGSENNNGNPYHPGDGGFIAKFSDGTVTDTSWKAQTFYIAPVQDLSQVAELPDSTRSTAGATTTPTCNANCYGIHYSIPSGWNSASFNDSNWPGATLYTTAQVGVNSAAYTNFTSAWTNASFIWSSNLILDNVVLVRKLVPALSGVSASPAPAAPLVINPFATRIAIVAGALSANSSATLYDLRGRAIRLWPRLPEFTGAQLNLDLADCALEDGLYILILKTGTSAFAYKLDHHD
jgi:hypothetical protein